MGNEQTALSFNQGITNVPSDATCDDNALEECLGMVFEDGEHRVIQGPADTGIVTSHRLVFVHKLSNGTKNYIYESVSSSRSLYCGSILLDNSTHSRSVGSSQIKAIGKTLIVSLDGALTYYLFKAGAYHWIGNNIPRPRMAFGMDGEPGSRWTIDQRTSYFNYIKGDNYVVGVDSEGHITDRKLYDDSVKGLYAGTKKKAESQKAFTLPFFIRYCLRLYDDSYTHISNPIPLFPNSVNTCFWNNTGFYLHAMYVVYKNLTTYEDWTDIVKGISIFVSRGIEFYDLALDSTKNVRGQYYEYDITRWGVNGMSQEDINRLDGFYPFEYRSLVELTDDLHSESVFYHLCDISATVYNGSWQQLKDHFSHIVLENLTTQDVLPYDNYYSLAPIGADYLYDYNNRLNISHVSRGFFEGFDTFSGLYGGQNFEYRIYVRIASESGERCVFQSVALTSEDIGAYFFYPDPRANHVTIYRDNVCIIDGDLIEHPGLNGAYLSSGWPGFQSSAGSPSPTLGDTDLNNTYEELFGYVVTSEVDNPFVYLAHGYNRAGTGVVLAMATLTQALSQGQFGQYPLLVFTDEGIWAMSVDKTGLFQSIEPLSRDVINRGTYPLQTDDAVFFASKKGLMVVGIERNGKTVRCVSEQLSGKACGTDISSLGFSDYMEGAFMAYDYRDSLIWIFNSTSGFSEYCFVYSIKSETFGKYCFAYDAIANVCNDYPDTLLQNESYNILSLIGRDDINDDQGLYTGRLITRPMKLDNALALKSIRQISIVGNMDGTVKYRLFASNTLKSADWVEQNSLHCMPHKYYRLQFDFTDMKATDRFGGAVIVSQERRTNKLR